MTTLITLAELEDLTETELRLKLSLILHELARKQRHSQDYPMIWMSITNIMEALRRK